VTRGLDIGLNIDNMRILYCLCALNEMPAELESRQKRQAAILDILQSQPVARQTELVAILRDQGIEATQSSVSRDLKQLGVSKLDQGYSQPAAPEEPVVTGSRGFVRDIQTAGGNLTVVKTAVGAAQRVAVYLDRSGWTEIVGTLSGDDTIFIATRNVADQRRLVTKLHTRFND
jgi:transcriptional regulator of arginine metabolism